MVHEITFKKMIDLNGKISITLYTQHPSHHKLRVVHLNLKFY